MAKILVIDDEPVVLALLDILLSQKGYDVVLADGGCKGLELYRRDNPDVVVLDLKMPELDGVMVLKEIRLTDLTQPVIIMTGAATPETEQQVRALGVTEIVEKDFTLDLLGDALTRLLKPSTLTDRVQQGQDTSTDTGIRPPYPIIFPNSKPAWEVIRLGHQFLTSMKRRGE